ncbi:MAG: glycosyltransferase family 4 protein, partial [bacterium]|nr:glycosyltransferase family 4 protein [bacterium]
AQVLRGDDVWVLTRDTAVARRMEAIGARFQRPPIWPARTSVLDMLPCLWLVWFFRRMSFNLVVTHNFRARLLGGLAARAAGVERIVHHAQEFRFQDVTAGLRCAWRRTLEKIAIRGADLLITASKEQRLYAVRERLHDPERIVTVPNGVVSPRLEGLDPAGTRRALGLEPSALLVGAVGRLEPGKGYQYLLQAMPTIVAHHPAARLV